MSGRREPPDRQPPDQLPFDELRARRRELQALDDAVSFVRRLVQARLDMVRARQRRVADAGEAGDVGTGTGTGTGELTGILAAHLTGGPARPPRPVDDFSDHPLAVELADLERRHGGAGIDALDGPALAAFADALEQFEQLRSAERRDVFAEIDALSAELVRRYRSGEADVGALLAAD